MNNKDDFEGCLTGILVIVVIALVIALAIVALILSTDTDLIKNLQNGEDILVEYEKDPSAWRYVDFGTCQMPGCEQEATISISYHLSTNIERHARLVVKNADKMKAKANFTVSTNAQTRDVIGSYTDKVNYVHLRPDGYGGFVASEEQYDDVHYFKSGTKTTHSSDIVGVYCGQHEEQAKAILITEVKNGVQLRFGYIVFVACFPWTITVLLAAALFIMSLGSVFKFEENHKNQLLKIILPLFVLLPIVYYLCSNMQNEDVSLYVKIFTFIIHCSISCWGAILLGMLAKDLK